MCQLEAHTASQFADNSMPSLNRSRQIFAAGFAVDIR
jgi:hypothetical protein